MNNLTIMYHYIRDNTGFDALGTSEFRQQLVEFKRKYDVVTLSESLALKDKARTCVLTFDDGLKDGITNAFPILQEMNLKAVFFIPGCILEQKKVVNVQKRHLLLSKIGSKKLVAEFNRKLPKELQIKADPAFKAGYLDDLLTCSLKWMLDFADNEITNPILSTIFNKHFPKEEEIFAKTYLSLKDLKTLLSAGMEIGVHGYSHQQLGTLTFTKQEEDIKRGTNIIKMITGNRPLYFSYPSGSYNPLTIRLLKKYRCKAAVTIKKHHNTFKTSRFELGRFDCIDTKI